MTVAAVRGLSPFAASSGTGSGLIRPWLAGHQAGWQATVVIVTQNQAPTLPSGFNPDPQSGIGTGTPGGPNAVMITVAHRTATQGVMDANGGVMPDIQIANPGNMVAWDVIFTSGQDTSASPFLPLTSASASVTTPANTAVSIPGGDSTGNTDIRWLLIAAHGKDTAQQIFDPTAWVPGTGLTNFSELLNTGTASGNGGGLAILTAEQAVGGVVGPTAGTMTSSAVQAHLALALKSAGAAPAAPASTHQCGAECGTTKHFDSTIGTLPTSQSTIARNGGKAWRFNPTTNTSAVGWSITETKQVMRGYLYFETLPSADCELVRFAVNPIGSAPELRFIAADHTIVGAVGTLLTTALSVVAGQWYLVSLAADVSTGTRTLKLTVDGVDKGTASKSVAAGVLTDYQFGASVETAISGSVIWDDVKIGPDVTLYPLGSTATNSAILLAQLTADGTHGFNAAGDFEKADGTDFAPAATDIWSNLIGLFTTPVLRVKVGTAVSTEYIEVAFGGFPAVTSIASLELLAFLAAVATGTNKQTARIVDGATVQDIWTDIDSGGTTGKFVAKHYPTAPSGGAWTQAKINALKARWGPGWGTIDVSPIPGLGGILAEVDCVLVSTPTIPPIHQQNPLYTYGSGGTKTVTLTVTDDSGLSASVTKNIVVP